MWSLYQDQKELKPLIFSNGKSQKDIVEEVIKSIEQGNKIIFIKGMCGTGKSAIALNLARHFGKTSIVVPIKSLQEQYTKDYSQKKYVLKQKDNKKLKIQSIVGRNNFKCKFLKEFEIEEELDKKLIQERLKEKNAKLSDIFAGVKKPIISRNPNKDTCDNEHIPCKIEIKEKNIKKLKEYIKQNPNVKINDFSSLNEVRRMTIAPICPYWSPLIPNEFEIKKFSNANKINYLGLCNKEFIIYQRRKGCPYYDQYEAYANADVIIFNSLKYKIENLMDRKPLTEVEIIDECDDFLDSFANKEQINLNRLSFALNSIFPENNKTQKIIDNLEDITKAIKYSKKFKDQGEIYEIKNTLIKELLETLLKNEDLFDHVEMDESNYLYHLEKVARIFQDFFDETFFSVEKRDNDLIIHLVTTNLAKRLNELVEKNKIIIMMSGTIHSENVLKNIFGLEKFKIIDAETKHQGNLIKCKYGYEINCSYANFQSQKINNKQYLFALSKSIACAKRPTLVHLTSFSDLPTEKQKKELNIHNLPTRNELKNQQIEDPFGQRIKDFKEGKTNILFTTKCNRGIDFPGETCNSIIITRFPYPNISSIFWRILKKTKPEYFMSFYMDKAKRELLQKIYRGLRSKNDKIYLLSPDIRVLNFKIE